MDWVWTSSTRKNDEEVSHQVMYHRIDNDCVSHLMYTPNLG